VTLVSYIVKHIDRATLNVRDQEGKNALFKCIECWRVDKIVPIALILIGAGIDINARQCTDDVDLPYNENLELDVTQLKGDSVFGSCIKKIQSLPSMPTIDPVPHKLVGLYKFAVFLKEQGAECYISDLGTISTAINPPQFESGDAQKKITRAQCYTTLQKVDDMIQQKKVPITEIYVSNEFTQLPGLPWLPEDVMKIIVQKIVHLT
jgi:hypothetical protein